MYHDEFFPFYTAYTDPAFYDRERLQEREYELMNLWYPQTVRRFLEYIREECDLLDYEGSRIYDEYPDRKMLERDYGRAQSRIKEKTKEPDLADDLIRVLFWQEISRRRCRRRRFWENTKGRKNYIE